MAVVLAWGDGFVATDVVPPFFFESVGTYPLFFAGCEGSTAAAVCSFADAGWDGDAVQPSFCVEGRSFPLFIPGWGGSAFMAVVRLCPGG